MTLPAHGGTLKSMTRTDTSKRYDLIPREAIDRMAARFEHGLSKYGPKSYADGTVEHAEIKRVALNHLVDHALEYQRSGDTKEDNLGSILANAGILAYLDANEPIADALPAGIYHGVVMSVVGNRMTFKVTDLEDGKQRLIKARIR